MLYLWLHVCFLDHSCFHLVASTNRSQLPGGGVRGQQFRLMTQARVCVRKNTNAQARRCLNVCILYSVRTVCTHMQPHNRHNDKLSLHLHWIKLWNVHKIFTVANYLCKLDKKTVCFYGYWKQQLTFIMSKGFTSDNKHVWRHIYLY